MAAILDFVFRNTISKVLSGYTTSWDIHGNSMVDTKRLNMCHYSVKNDGSLLFDLEQMATILDVLPTL